MESKTAMSRPIKQHPTPAIIAFIETSSQYLGLPNLKTHSLSTSSYKLSTPPAYFAFQRKIVTHYRKLIPSLLLATGLGAIFAGPAFADAGCGGMGGHTRHHEQHAKHMEQHHKMLHDALKLSADQEPAWKTLIDSEQHRPATGAVPADDWSKLNAPQRAEKMLEMTKARQEQMNQHVTALKAFYATLSPEQQKTFEDFHAGPRSGMRGKQGPGAPKLDKAAPPSKP